MLLSKASGRWRRSTQDSDCKVSSLDWLAFCPSIGMGAKGIQYTYPRGVP